MQVRCSYVASFGTVRLLFPVIGPASSTPTVPAMPVMHKQMHKRAQQQQEVREDAEQVSPVLGKKKEGDYAEKDWHYPADTRLESPRGS